MLLTPDASCSHFHAVFLARLTQEPAVLVHVESTQGSAPRDAGTWMAVFADALVGTVGGGHLEHAAIAQARALLKNASASCVQAACAADDGRVIQPIFQPTLQPTHHTMRFALGPALGQCCGGVVHVRFEPVRAQDVPALAVRLQQARLRTLAPVALFGGGHVGHALTRLLVSLPNLPFALTWIDSRDGIFPAGLPSSVVCEHSEPVQAAVRSLAAQSRVLIMSFSHAEDLDILSACLQRQREQADLPYIGLIGSKTKWATFGHRLQARGFTPAELAHVTSPIGVPGIAGKEPEVIAVAVVAQLLQTTSRDADKVLA
ncbi:MAG: xanthine dehydrogenase accessory protein XdhC [Polaromonas sp.]|nr:MAG: xanthine dehydrogenase accessory protein XdhC [Polaromonas sp.]